MKYEKKFHQPKSQQISEIQSHSQSAQRVREFATPEEMLRFDAGQTHLPETIAQRLSVSLQRNRDHRQPWWKRWFQ